MNSFVSQVGSAALIGGCIGGIISGTLGYFFSTDTTEEYQRRILVGMIAGATLACLGMTITTSYSNGAVKSSVAAGALFGCVRALGEFENIHDPHRDHRILGIVQEILLFIAFGAVSGYCIGKVDSYMASLS